MTALHRLTRRTLLRASLVAGAWTSFFGTRARAAAPGFGEGSIETRLAVIARPRASARRIGEACLAAQAVADDPQALVAVIGRSVDLRRLSTEQLRSRVYQQHLLDLDRDAVVLVDGWLLSRTEASLFALAALVDT